LRLDRASRPPDLAHHCKGWFLSPRMTLNVGVARHTTGSHCR
jgi:hypothetical protein